MATRKGKHCVAKRLCRTKRDPLRFSRAENATFQRSSNSRVKPRAASVDGAAEAYVAVKQGLSRYVIFLEDREPANDAIRDLAVTASTSIALAGRFLK